MAKSKRLPGKSKTPVRRKTSARKSKLTLKRGLYMAGILALITILSLTYWFLGAITSFKSSKLYYYNPYTLSPEAFADTLKAQGYIRSAFPLKWVLEHREINSLRPGLFEINKGVTAYGLASDIARIGVIDHLKLEIERYRQRKNILIGLAKQTDLSSSKLNALMSDEQFLDSLGGLNRENAWTIFIPGVYRFPKHISERQLLENIYDAQLFYWNTERTNQAGSAGLAPQEAMVLASIVYAETKNTSEMPMIAGVYINRLNKKMKLQADPTALYAAGDFTSNRVRGKHLEMDSKYNTYRYKGLPPGPICIPSQDALHAVLHYNDHNYLYFCAKDDFSGCHSFAENFEEHRTNADKLWKALNKRKIK